MQMIRSIKISEETYQGLIARMSARETFNDVIQRLLQSTARKPRTRKPQQTKTEGFHG